LFVVQTNYKIREGSEDTFVKYASADKNGSRCTETGNFLFDVIRLDNTNYLSYEVYKDKDAFDKHEKTQHYKDFRERLFGLVTDFSVVKKCVNKKDEDFPFSTDKLSCNGKELPNPHLVDDQC